MVPFKARGGHYRALNQFKCGKEESDGYLKRILAAKRFSLPSGFPSPQNPGSLFQELPVQRSAPLKLRNRTARGRRCNFRGAAEWLVSCSRGLACRSRPECVSPLDRVQVPFDDRRSLRRTHGVRGSVNARDVQSRLFGRYAIADGATTIY
jgi:hypothetical protein